MLPVARRVPLLFGELGESVDGQPVRVGGGADASSAGPPVHNVSWAAWTWDTWGTCGSLISSYSGTPANPYAAFVHQTLKASA